MIFKDCPDVANELHFMWKRGKIKCLAKSIYASLDFDENKNAAPFTIRRIIARILTRSVNAVDIRDIMSCLSGQEQAIKDPAIVEAILNYMIDRGDAHSPREGLYYIDSSIVVNETHYDFKSTTRQKVIDILAQSDELSKTTKYIVCELRREGYKIKHTTVIAILRSLVQDNQVGVLRNGAYYLISK